jgi:hypothetical protein
MTMLLLLLLSALLLLLLLLLLLESGCCTRWRRQIRKPFGRVDPPCRCACRGGARKAVGARSSRKHVGVIWGEGSRSVAAPALCCRAIVSQGIEQGRCSLLQP